MNARAISLILVLAASSAFGSGPKASACLASPDAKDCLATVAARALASEKSPESKIDGYASLITSMATVGIRRDDIFSKATDDEAAPVLSRWSLAVARRMYGLRFGIDTNSVDSLERIEALAELLRGRRDGFDTVMVAWTACEAREGSSPSARVKWEGVLDRLCRLDVSKEDVLENAFPGLSASAATVVDAYNRDTDALRRSMTASLYNLAEYERALDRKMPLKEREAIQGVMAFGHLVNAIAFAIAGYETQAAKATKLSLEQAAKAPAIRNAHEFKLLFAQVPWIFAKAGMRDEAMVAMRETLAYVDGSKNIQGGDSASCIAVAIEALEVLESPLRR